MELLRCIKKSEVEKRALAEYVVMPTGINLSFMKWWKSLTCDDECNVRYPHSRHGNAGNPSNSAKTGAKVDFLEFIDINSQPNGRSADSTSATYFLLPKFRTIQTPKPGVARFEQRVRESLLGEFNRCQEEAGKPTISNYSASTWLKKERPKHSIYPHKLDYCDTCAKLSEKIRASQTTLNRIRQVGSADRENQLAIETSIADFTKQLENHKDEAHNFHRYYVDTTKQCQTEWLDIIKLESKENKTEDEVLKLEILKQKFTLILSADFQMQKLVPYWGQSPQPGSTCYLQKLSHDIFGVCDHRISNCMLYVFDETVGLKNTDHTISYLEHYIHVSGKVPNWVKRVHIFLDNTVRTNKNAYFMAWALENLQQSKP